MPAGSRFAAVMVMAYGVTIRPWSGVKQSGTGYCNVGMEYVLESNKPNLISSREDWLQVFKSLVTSLVGIMVLLVLVKAMRLNANNVRLQTLLQGSKWFVSILKKVLQKLQLVSHLNQM